MSQAEFDAFQEAILLIFGPLIQWALTFIAAGGIISGIMYIWLGLLRWLTRRSID